MLKLKFGCQLIFVNGFMFSIYRVKDLVNREKPKAKLRSIISKRRYYPKRYDTTYMYNFNYMSCLIVIGIKQKEGNCSQQHRVVAEQFTGISNEPKYIR